MLVQVGVICHQVSRLLLKPVGGDGLQQVAHLHLLLVAFYRCLHFPLLDEPKLQGRGPGGQAEDGSHIAAPYGVGDISFRPVGPALQPAVVGHAGAVAEDDGFCHQYSTPFARSYSSHRKVRARARDSATANSLLSGAWSQLKKKGISCMARNTSWAVAGQPP